ncbi:MAG: hypothetical protein LUG44_04445 [Clostridiales bacterium]|nr:hypothetical protein [Clostridiales bacterium]
MQPLGVELLGVAGQLVLLGIGVGDGQVRIFKIGQISCANLKRTGQSRDVGLEEAKKMIRILALEDPV